MARRASRKPRPEREAPGEKPVVATPEEEGSEAEVEVEETAPPAPPAPPIRLDTYTRMGLFGFAGIGALVGTITCFANWGMSPLAALTGFMAGLSIGTAIGHSLCLTFQRQAAVMLVLLVLSFALYSFAGYFNLAPVGLVTAGGVALLVSLRLQRTE